MPDAYQAVLVLSFGGPEKRDEVIPFLENVLRGKSVPRERMMEVAEHYYHFDGRSPINDQNRQLIAALSRELGEHGPRLPVYWGNRNWHPLLAATLREMRDNGIRRAMVFVTSAFSSYSGCRQYLEDIDRARAEVGEDAPHLDKLRGFHNHPGFIDSVTAQVEDAFKQIPAERRPAARLLFTAHSVPVAMAHGSPYLAQLQEACSLVAQRLGRPDWDLVFQSRSGPPSQPWLEPDIGDAFARVREELGSGGDVVVSPIGFVSDHMEVLYDLDTEAMQFANKLGINMVRAGTPGAHPRFVSMIRELIADSSVTVCAPDCCPPPARRG
jgi:protoporphyrin/coproporphyrin ferrochelatase